jgi:hypothetical protein
MNKSRTDDDSYSADEAARWRDEVIRRMANTPPQPKVSHRPKRKTKTGAGRVARKERAHREA